MIFMTYTSAKHCLMFSAFFYSSVTTSRTWWMINIAQIARASPCITKLPVINHPPNPFAPAPFPPFHLYVTLMFSTLFNILYITRGRNAQNSFAKMNGKLIPTRAPSPLTHSTVYSALNHLTKLTSKFWWHSTRLMGRRCCPSRTCLKGGRGLNRSGNVV